MNAIILAAGRGSRLKKMTKSKPKCFLELGGKSLLQWQTEALRSGGISSIAIIRGYRKESFYQSYYQYFDNPRWEETNMVYTLSCAESILKQNTCLISYSDIIYHPSIICALKDSSGDIAITYDQKWKILWSERFKNPLEDAETFQTLKGQLKTIGEKASDLSEIQGQYMGLLKITPNGWEKIARYLSSLSPKTKDKLDMTTLLNRLLENRITIVTVPIQGKWCEIDREEDLKLYEQKLLCPNWIHDWRYKNE